MKSPNERIDLVILGTKILSFLNLLDRKNNLSITNVAVIVLVTKMAISAFDWPTAAGLMITLLNYGHKRHESNKASKDLEQSNAIAALQEQVAKVSEQVVVIESTNVDVLKQAEEVRKIVQNHNLKEAFAPRGTR